MYERKTIGVGSSTVGCLAIWLVCGLSIVGCYERSEDAVPGDSRSPALCMDSTGGTDQPLANSDASTSIEHDPVCPEAVTEDARSDMSECSPLSPPEPPVHYAYVPVQELSGMALGIPATTAPVSMVISPSGENVYASFSMALGPGIEGPSLVTLSRDDESGTLEPISTLVEPDYSVVDVIAYPKDLAMDPAGEYLLFASPYPGYDLTIARLDSESGVPTQYHVFQAPSGGEGQQLSVAVSPDRKYIYTGGSQGIFIYRFKPNEAIVAEPLQYLYESSHFMGIYGVSALTMSDSGSVLFAFVNKGELWVYQRDLATGALHCKQRFSAGMADQQWQYSSGLRSVANGSEVLLFPRGGALQVYRTDLEYSHPPTSVAADCSGPFSTYLAQVVTENEVWRAVSGGPPYGLAISPDSKSAVFHMMDASMAGEEWIAPGSARLVGACRYGKHGKWRFEFSTPLPAHCGNDSVSGLMPTSSNTIDFSPDGNFVYTLGTHCGTGQPDDGLIFVHERVPVGL